MNRSSRFLSLAALIVGLLVEIPLATGASFDCHKAGTAVEKLICSSSDVRLLDVRLYEIYRRTINLTLDKKTVRSQQRKWLSMKRNTCKTTECLTDVYETRISELEKGLQYEECVNNDHTSNSEGYCNGRIKQEALNSIDDLVEILAKRHSSQQMKQFNQIQRQWKKDIECSCWDEIGWGNTPSHSALLVDCERKLAQQRLSEVRQIVAEQQNLEYGRIGVRTCTEIQQERDSDPENQLIKAISKNDIKTVKRLVSEGTKIPSWKDGQTPLRIAARNNNLEMVSYLLSEGADPKRDTGAMRAALNTCNSQMVSLLVEHGYKVKGDHNYGPYDPLPWAASLGCTSIIKYFVSEGADVKLSKPLRSAAAGCHVDTVKYLLDKGEDPNISDMGERTPIWYAAIEAVNYPEKRSACKTVINDLLQAGANPDRAFIVPTENPGLKLPRDDEEINKLLRSRLENNQK